MLVLILVIILSPYGTVGWVKQLILEQQEARSVWLSYPCHGLAPGICGVRNPKAIGIIDLRQLTET